MNMTILKALFTLAFTLVAASAMAQRPLPSPEPADEPIPPVTLAELAASADLVALVRVADTDYQYARSFPTGGMAFLQVLIPYRVTEPYGDFVIVYEEGLHANECYFPDPSVVEEGRRFLVFLRINPDFEGQYVGLEQGCALQVLVDNSNLYALRYPLSGIEITDDVTPLASPMVFADRYAVFSDDDMTVAERNDLLEGGFLAERDDGGFKYTHGVALSDIRKLLGDDNLTMDRHKRRQSPDDAE